MDESLKKILGVDRVDDPMLPGTRPRDAGKVIYVLLPRGTDPSDAFDEVTTIIDPPLPRQGAVLLEHWVVQIPNGDKFYSLYFHGDVGGWRRQIELGADRLGLQLAIIKGNEIVVSNGKNFRLSDCVITLAGTRM